MKTGTVILLVVIGLIVLLALYGVSVYNSLVVLKNRVKSGQPILLEECANVVQRSLRDTAAYAGLAAPIRDVQKILNSGVETRDQRLEEIQTRFA